MSRKLSFFAGSLAAALIGWAAGVGAQTSEPAKLPPLPPATDAQAADQGTQQQRITPQPAAPQQATAAPANGSTGALPPLPLDHDGIHEVQGQLIALGFNPGPADGETGPATMSAVQQYNESRGGTGPVPVDGRLLARLQQDTGPRLTPEQVAARSQPHYAPAPADPVAGMVQQFQSTIGALLNGGY
ncbi:MAG TPA: peptidoglycan-binding domain-containing protein [Reyranella sp.]|jgi:hypothetical protein